MKDTKTLKGGLKNMDMKIKVRLGRNLGFELRRPKEQASVTELKARIRQLETRVLQQQRYMNALARGFTYIRDEAGAYYRLYNNGMAAKEDESFLHIEWDNLTTTLRDGKVVAFCRTLNGSIKEWSHDEAGKFVALN